MGDAVEVAIILAAKDAASGVLGGIGSSLDKLGKSGDVAKLALAGVTAGLGAAVFAGFDFVRAAAEEEQGIFRLAQAVQNAGGDWDVLGETIEGQIAKWEKLTAFSDGEMRDALSLLTASTGNVEESMNRLPIAMDFARGAGIDLATASKLLGKVTDETTNVLGRYGIHVQKGAEATEVLAEVQKRFGGQSAAFASTAAGQWKIFQNQLDNVKEDLGALLLPLFTELGRIGVGAMDALRAAISSPEFQRFFAFIGGALSTAITIFKEFFGVITGTAPDAGAALSKLVGPEAAGAIMQYLALIRDTVKAIFAGDIPAVLATMRTRLPDIIGGLLGFIKSVIPQLGAALVGWAKEFIAWIGPQIPPMLEELLHLLSSAIGWLGDHAEDIGQMLVQWGLKFGEFIITVAIPEIQKNLPPILLTIGKWVVTEALPGIVKIFFNLGKGIVEGIWAGIQGLWSWLLEQIHAKLMELPELVRNLLGIHSPSTVFAEIGEELARGMALGMTTGQSLVRSAGGALAAAALAGVAYSSSDNLKERGSGLLSDIRESFAGKDERADTWREMLGLHPRDQQGHEIENPFGAGSLDRSIARAERSALASELGRGARAEVTIPLMLDGREIARAMGEVIVPAAGASGRGI
jgi:hypothetical protein